MNGYISKDLLFGESDSLIVNKTRFFLDQYIFFYQTKRINAMYTKKFEGIFGLAKLLLEIWSKILRCVDDKMQVYFGRLSFLIEYAEPRRKYLETLDWCASSLEDEEPNLQCNKKKIKFGLV